MIFDPYGVAHYPECNDLSGAKHCIKSEKNIVTVNLHKVEVFGVSHISPHLPMLYFN